MKRLEIKGPTQPYERSRKYRISIDHIIATIIIINMSRLLQSRVQYRALFKTTTSHAKPIRNFTSSRKTMVEAKEISPSQGESTEALVSQTTALVDSGRWKLCNDGKGLERQFKFRTFKATWVYHKIYSSSSRPATDMCARTS